MLFKNIFRSGYVGPDLRVVWHTGEPLVLGPDYYRRAIDLITSIHNDYMPSTSAIGFDIQTNATLIDDAWCALFQNYSDVLRIGVSCDGPAFLHDAHRKNWAGKPTHKQTVFGMDLLRKSGVPFDVISVVSVDGLMFAEEFLQFFTPYKECIRDFHFNLHEEFEFALSEREEIESYIGKYRLFIKGLLAAYQVRPNVCPPPRLRNFSAFYDMVLSEQRQGRAYDARSMSEPVRTLNLQANGEVSTFYAGLTADHCSDLYGDGRGMILGNLLHEDLTHVFLSPKFRRIIDDFERSHEACETGCSYYGVCSGGYNLIKYKRFGRFDVTETPECLIHVKTFADAVLEDLNQSAV